MIVFKPVTSLFFSVAVLPLVAVAEDFEQHAAHEHGAAMLNLVQEGGQVMIELNSPAANIVGFEHRARNDEQRAIVKKAMEQLALADDLFVFAPDAECRANKVDLDAEIFRNESDDNHIEHNEHNDDHHDSSHEKHAEHEAHHQDEEHHQEKHEEHHDDDHHEAGHSDIVANYTFNCKNPNDINYVDVMLFKVFPGFEEIDAQVISIRGQNAIELSVNNHRISL